MKNIALVEVKKLRNNLSNFI